MLTRFAEFSLSKETMRRVTGGCGSNCPGGWGNQYGISKKAAKQAASACDGKWCCASC